MFKSAITFLCIISLLGIQLQVGGNGLQISYMKAFAASDCESSGSGDSTDSEVASGGCSSEEVRSQQAWGWMGLIIGIAGILSSAFWVENCIGQLAPLITLIAGIVGILGEIIAWSGYLSGKKGSTELAQVANATYESKEEVDTTKTSVKAALEETDAALKWAAARLIIGYVIAVAYIVAAIIAFIKGAYGNTLTGLGSDLCLVNPTPLKIKNLNLKS